MRCQDLWRYVLSMLHEFCLLYLEPKRFIKSVNQKGTDCLSHAEFSLCPILEDIKRLPSLRLAVCGRS